MTGYLGMLPTEEEKILLKCKLCDCVWLVLVPRIITVIVQDLDVYRVNRKTKRNRDYLQYAHGASQMVQWVGNQPAMQETQADASSISGSGRSPGGGHNNSCQCSCLENPMDRGAW